MGTVKGPAEVLWGLGWSGPGRKGWHRGKRLRPLWAGILFFKGVPQAGTY